MRSTLYPYVMATVALTIFPAGARAGNAEPVRNSCGRPDIPARLAQRMPIEVSRFDQIAGAQYGNAFIAVTLAPDGRLLRAAVLHGSGNARFDENALQAIRQSTFTPEQRNCGNVGGTYEVEADSTTDTE